MTYSFLVAWVIAFAIKKTVGIRISIDDEAKCIDVRFHVTQHTNCNPWNPPSVLPLIRGAARGLEHTSASAPCRRGVPVEANCDSRLALGLGFRRKHSAPLVMTLGGAQPGEVHARFPGNPIVVSFAPQLELLARSALFITHGGSTV